MSSCNYFYKGRLIGNIRQLDDFLLERQCFESTLGDMVFQKNLTSHQLDAVEKVNKSQKKVAELNKAYENAKAEAKAEAREFGVDSEDAILKMKRPYVGVSEFLTGQRNYKNILYFPEFIAQNYWSERYHEWAKGNFNDDEIDLFFGGGKSKPIPIGNVNDWRDNKGIFKEKFLSFPHLPHMQHH